MKLLVTGGLGFIGSTFIRYVLSKHLDNKVVNIDKMGIGANPENLKQLENKTKYSFIKGDISDFKLVQEAIKDVDVVVNFAAETHVDRSISDPGLFLENNLMGTFNLLEAERRLGKKIRHIQISTDEVYGDILEGSFSEQDRLKPSNPYAASKASADMLCCAYHRTYGMDVLTTRCANNFGPYQFPEKLIPKTIIRGYRNLPIPVYGTGKNMREWLYVGDHCSAIETVIEKGQAGEIYNISSGHEHTNIELVEKILELMGREKSLVKLVPDRPGHDLRYSLDVKKIKKLGWNPKYSFEKALQSTIKWYINNELWWKPLATQAVLAETPWIK